MPECTAPAVVVATLAMLPFGHHAVGPSVSAVPALVAIVAVFDLMSVYLLMGDYRDRGDLRLAVMAGAYAWSLVVMAAYALAFLGAVTSDPPLAITPSMAPYFYVAWHGSFPVVLAAAWSPWPAAWTRPTVPARRTRTGATLLSAFVHGRGRTGVNAGLASRVASGADQGPGHLADDQPDCSPHPAGGTAVRDRHRPRQLATARARAMDLDRGTGLPV